METVLEGSDPWDLVTTYDWAYNPTNGLPSWPHVVCPSFKYGYGLRPENAI